MYVFSPEIGDSDDGVSPRTAWENVRLGKDAFEEEQ